jgi:hypothetical protein
VVVHTLLTKPENANAAIDFYRSRTAVTAQRFSRAAAEYYSRHQEFSANAFWRARAAGAAPELSRVPRGKLESAGLDTPIRLAAAVTIADTPVIEGDLVHSRPAVSVPGIELPVAWLDGHEVAALVQSLAQTRTLGEVLRLWSRELPDREAWRILSWLWDHAMIEPEPMTARVR